MKKTKIALLGLGTVGTGAWKIIRDNGSIIEEKTGCSLEIARILVKNLHKKRSVELPEGILTVDYNSIISDPDIDIIVEVIGGIAPARDYILRALQAGKQVVTANKALLAQYGSEIFATAARHKSAIRYEASVCGGIPISSLTAFPFTNTALFTPLTPARGCFHGILSGRTSSLYFPLIFFAVATSLIQAPAALAAAISCCVKPVMPSLLIPCTSSFAPNARCASIASLYAAS